MNPLFNQFGDNQYSKMLKSFNDFKKNLSGNPEEQVKNLLNSGKVSQAQYNQAVQKANMLRNFFGV